MWKQKLTRSDASRQKQKNRVLARDGHRCVMSGSSDGIYFDRVIPVSKGGNNTEDNIQILCKDCNLHKYGKIP